jgi:zinc protease
MSFAMRALVGFMAILALLASPAAAQSSGDWTPESFSLKNGMRVVVLPDHRAPVITHMLWYRVGSADETPGKSGLAHFFEHLMFKATTDQPADEYSKTVARNGGQANAGTSFDFTNYHFRIAKDRLALMMRMEADRIVNLQLGEDEVLSERKVVQEERRQVVESNPESILEEKVWAKLYAGHPYAVPIIGHMDEVAALSRADALGWYRSWYGPENAILVVAGDITAAELKPLAEDIYGVIPRRGNLKVRAMPPVKPLTTSFEVSHSDPKVRQPTWSRNWLGVAMGDRDAAALQVGMHVLAGGRTSRLYGELVEGGQAVMAYGYSYEMEARGALSVSVQPAPGVSIETIRSAALANTDKFLREGPTREELDRAKRLITADAVFRRDNQMDMANWYGGMLTAGLTIAQIERYESDIAAVTAEQVRSAMNRYMRLNHVDSLLLPAEAK